MSSCARGLTVVVALGVVLSPGLAYAKDWGDKGARGDITEKGSLTDGTATATAGAKITYDQTGGSSRGGSGQMMPVGNWTPPACWYAPKWTADEAAQSRFDGLIDLSPQHDADNADSMREKYIDGKHGPFNTKKGDEGYWWGVYKNPDRMGDAAAMECTEMPFWVATGDEPPTEIANTISPEILAQLAYEQIRIPEATPTLQPEGDKQVVNLHTWVSLDDAAFQPVSVTASVEALGISATTTATPGSLRIEPGTDDALTFPESGECPLNDDGSVGQKRPAGAEGPPPCGVQYLRSTEATGPYAFEGTVTWKVSWTGSSNPEPTDLPSGTFGTAQDVTVREVQSVVR
ncbi:hypothetical protein [Streptomyces sp. 184]|uniref:hypothetical protein n=1 Tax=Streptomyces sp. 184 TaxID=1827526 RepID=UPI00389133F3